MSKTDQFYDYTCEKLPFGDEVYAVIDVCNVGIERSNQPRWSVRLGVLL